MQVSCNNAYVESTKSRRRFPLDATCPLPYNVQSYRPELYRHTSHF